MSYRDDHADYVMKTTDFFFFFGYLSVWLQIWMRRLDGSRPGVLTPILMEDVLVDDVYD